MAGLPLHDAILIENGVVSRVNRIAYAISHTADLANAFARSGVTRELVAAAETAAEGFRVATFGGQARAGVGQPFPGRGPKGSSPFAAGKAGQNLEGRAKSVPIVKVSKTAKRLIAAELGVLVAYDRGVKRKALQASQFGKQKTGYYDANRTTKSGRKGTVVGRKGVKSEGRDARLARLEQLKAAREGDIAGRWGAIESSLRSSGFDWVDRQISQAGWGGRHAQAEDNKTDSWAFAKAKLRGKYREQGGPGWYDIPEMRKAYDAELAQLTGSRRASGVDKGARKAQTVSRGKNVSPKQARARKVKTNPFSDVGDLALTNPGTGVGFLDSIEDSVSGLPVVGGYVAPLIAPALLGAAAAGIHAVAVPKLKSMLPENVQPYAYSIAGAAVAVVASVIAGKATDETTKNLAGLLGGAALAFGVGFDVNSALEAKMGANKAGDDDFGGLALSGHDEYGALALGEAPSALGALALGEAPSALGAVALGDGMAYQTAPLGFDGATSSIHSAYGDASLADAYFSGPDFDAAEGEAIMAGASAFGAAAGRPPRLATGQKKAQSHYAGRQYHRWGWLIKQISFPALQQVAALPPDERLKVINQLRSQALALVARASEQAKAEQLASSPLPAAPELAAQGAMAGYDMNGYGALVLAGGGY